MSSARRLLEELNKSRRDGGTDQLQLQLVDEDDLYRWRATISGLDGPYEGGVWAVDIAVPASYPFAPPEMRFRTPMCHPNVHIKTGEICLDILKTEWTPAWTLESACMAVISLLSDPAIDNPLNIDAANVLRAGDRQAYEGLVRYHTRRHARA
ncbi:UBC5 ubiquitin-conjugating enzyme [Dipodascopsis tothii]|uniref:UBC5 ubiquitin-conjugating enzyme n=1 Tax=Dipodascopsis tothii TaxID=44089 RepID=UPI0034CF82A5